MLTEAQKSVYLKNSGACPYCGQRILKVGVVMITES